MATLSEADSRRMYSWWWDSHISPKNSKWLQENLTDMDAKVKAMIKVIEEDADSFARRAEMYYKKRPELMKLVEEFYRAYRALAERYDHATGVLRQAHRTMAEAFPNQVPFVLADDSPGNSASEADLHTPELSPNTNAFLEPDDLQKDALGLSSSHFHAVKRKVVFNDESDSVTSRKGLNQINDLFGSGDHAKFTEERVRNGPNFEDAGEKEQSVRGNDNYALHPCSLSESERVNKSEKEILILKEALAKLEAEKEAGLIKYQECLSKLESEVSRAQEDSKGLNERASQAEYGIQNLKEALTKLEAEKKASLLQYQQHLEMISKLENVISHAQEDAGELNERVNKAETEAQTLKQSLATVEAEKDVALDQYKQSLEMISDLKNQLWHAKEDYGKINERAVKAENEVEVQKEVLAKLIEEKDAAALEYQQCLETISNLKHKISCMQDEAQRLNGEIDNGAAKLKHAEELCLLLERSNESLHSELESLTLKMSSQNEELSEKQKELGRLWTCIQEERLRFMEAETAFQTLQRLHAQTQEELRSLSLELHNRTQISRDMETHNQSLQDEIQKIKEENNRLSEINLSSATSMKGMQDEIFSLRKTNGKLEEEMELRLDQRNALQQEIYCLKEELLELNKQYREMLEQMTAVGLNPECFELSVKKLQDDNSNLNETCQRERSEKVALLEKLEVMGELLQKNAFVENSLSNLSVKLEGAKGKIKALKESCEILSEEKSTLANEKATLIAQLQVTTENLDKLSAKNVFLEDSILDARDELEVLKAKSKGLEDSCQVLDNENSGLINEMNNLASQLEISQQNLKGLEGRFTELEEKCSCLEKEKQSTLCKVEELHVSLDVEKPKDVTITELSETWLAGMEATIHLLWEEIQRRKKESEEELYRTVDSQIEAFVLQRCIQDLKENNFSLLIKHQKVLEASKLSEKLISQLKHENLEKQVEMKSLFDQTNKFSESMYHLLMAVDIDVDRGCKDKIGEDQTCLNHMMSKLEDAKISVCKTRDENQQLMVEMSILVTLLEQLRLEAANLKTERNILDQELKIRTEQLSVVQNDTQKLFGMSEELRLKVKEGDQKGEALTTQIENLHKKLSDRQWAYENLQKEHVKVLEEKKSCTKWLSDLEEQNHNLNEENLVMFGDFLSLSNLCLILKNFIDEKSVELKVLVEGLDNLQGANIVLKENLGTVRGMLEEVQMENSHLKESFQNYMDELKAAVFVNDQLSREITTEKSLLHSKEKELSEVGWKLRDIENERSGLLNIVEDLKRECNGANMIKENQEKQIFELTEERDRFSKENECLNEVKCRMEVELHCLHEELKKGKNTEERLCSELQNGKNEVNMWETEAIALFSKLQFSTIYQVLFEEKFNVLTEAYESLKSQSASKNIEAELLKERISASESENGQLKAQLASYFSAVTTLRECISSLENHPCLRTKFQKSDHEEAKDPELTSYQHVGSCLCEDQSAVVPDALTDLHDLQSSIKVIEMAVIEMERVAMQENIKVNAELEAAMRKIEELRSKRSLRQENAKPASEIAEAENGLPTKDIMLDQISECSSHGMSRREHVEADPQMLELWEMADHDCSIDLTVGKAKRIVSAPTEKDIRYHKIELAREQKGAHTNSEMQAEEELSVDKLEISKKPTESSPKGNGGKILERLNSDIQKLTNLQITVQDLKRKVEITEKRTKGKAIVECDTVKGELEEADEAILKLFNLNGKLMKSIEEGTLSYGKPAMESEESRSSRRKKVSEQARRLSEKIGRLQLDIQKIQFVLLRVDERESRVRTRIPETKRRVLLQDYLSGGVRTSHRQKKASCCACVQPPTKGD